MCSREQYPWRGTKKNARQKTARSCVLALCPQAKDDPLGVSLLTQVGGFYKKIPLRQKKKNARDEDEHHEGPILKVSHTPPPEAHGRYILIGLSCFTIGSLSDEWDTHIVTPRTNRNPGTTTKQKMDEPCSRKPGGKIAERKNTFLD